MYNWKEIRELKEKMERIDISVSLDFDEKLWDLHSATAPFIKKIYGVEVNKEDISYWEYMTDRFPRIKEAWGSWEVYKNGKPIEGSIDFVEILKYIFGEDRIQIVTATFPQIAKEKDELIKSIYKIDKIIHTSTKYEFTKNSILMDDGLHNIIGHVANNDCPGIIFDRNYGWNQEKIEESTANVYRAKSYSSVISILNSIY
jgi:hypothetical protein